ncbi:MAG: aspartyl/glutamyl-tRNA amidotransferase subunit A [Gammaproteobacteria bacterium RIFCSPLOWO2_02_FULL_47_50]|uniref:Glutamyl-tRNA(Gln) amidotransferase subunit A n=2 Tax=environmental samples TaxID=50423 RepID=A0A0H4TT59_9GAMM|nr:aspartyl/glutamyl-tRNA amidotransferase subunit A, aspartyl-tRNA(Asn)/glutamyl-tRNA (Gln) amidotransferase subunit A [uncultured gamma proteobacterium Rifle_16ft_4_minimus_39789]OGT76742.1 MAG: aspartyl/glutamyl-tRNA amidotransferase subunit A [Gammaproteobacteria bacterium RIFCSPLOWO2_12_47_11]OGT80136.1 MAG: aspartyl/glutamyl-tRNA amidotransferase subunit A [Gammaproteobacteria bacterium RIFCSPLOWO2_02_FULL_47_50]
MHKKNIAELVQVLQHRDISSVELTRLVLERCTNINQKLNCFISITPEHALLQAKLADEKINQGNAGPLTGIPIAQKDIFCTDGVKTSCGSKMLDNFIAPYDATVVEKLNNAGMVMIGKTNMDEFAMGSSNETSFYGPVLNPWDMDRVPGGSSGGSAAAVAARLVPVATGTDTGGSIRQPASLCGITGLKPTYGRISRYGMIAFASSLDQGGPMTRTAEDAALIMNAIAGFDERDSTSAENPVEDYTQHLNNSIAGLKIGLPKEYFDEQLNPDIGRIIHEGVKELEKLGANVKEISLPGSKLSIPVYYVVAPAECSSNLARFDGVRFGYRCNDPEDLSDLYCRSRGEGFGREVKRRIMIGTYVLSAGYYDAYYLKAQKIRRLIRDEFRQALSKVDVIIGPTAPGPAFRINELLDDPITMYLSDIYTVSVNLAGLPAISIPAGMLGGLPVGMQVIGNYFAEPRLLNIAHRFQQVTHWHKLAPAGFD